MARSRLAIVVAYSFSAVPGHGGSTWALLQYVLGLRQLGHRVIFVDPIQTGALRPGGCTLSESTNSAYFRAVAGRFGLEDSSALLLCDGLPETVGLSFRAIASAVRESDVLINISGVLRDEGLLSLARRRVYLDLDPGFTQLWHAVQGIDMGFRHHTDFVTIGRAIGTPECSVPTCGLAWIPTWQPVVLEHWPAANSPGTGALTTVANWRGYGSIEHDGVLYGQKVHAWRPIMALPTRTTERIEVALGIDPGESNDVQALSANGWVLLDPAQAAGTPERYQDFVRASKAELGIAKSGYVISRTGWISDRSISYLASGRPVLAHNTGFNRFLPAGDGLLTFESLDQLLDRIAQLNDDYPKHARAARALAEEYFESDTVLKQLLANLRLS